MANVNVLFEGATRRPVREYLAMVWRDGSYRTGVLPAVGRFTAAAGLVAGGAKPSQLRCSDVSLLSSVVGYLLDPEKDLDELAIEIKGDARHFVGRSTSELNWAAGVLLAQKYLDTPPTNPYTASVRRQLKTDYLEYRRHIAGQLETLQDQIGGIHYEVADARSQLDPWARQKTALFFMNPPGYKGGYRKMFEGSETALKWRGLEWEPLEPAQLPELVAPLADVPMTTLLYLKADVANLMGEEWTRLVGLESKLYGWTGTVTDYLLANRDLDRRRVVLREKAGHNAQKLAIYDDDEITAESTIEFRATDKNTALWYRDLFVHRLGTTAARSYYLLLIDGRVTTSLGLSWVEVLRGKRSYVSETFGITKTSQRYARLGKLFMLLLTSGDMRRYLEETVPSLVLKEYRGIETSSITEHHEAKTDRGVMQLVSRESLPHGGFRVTYRADFRDDTWAETVADWLEKHGKIRR